MTVTLPHQTNKLHIFIEEYKPQLSHNPKKKRRLLADEKEELKQILRGKSAYAVRSQLANAMVVEGLPVPAHMPSLNTIRKIKSADQCPEKQDAIEGLNDLNSVYIDCIQNIGYIPFYVFYATPSQHAWLLKEIAASERLIFSIDATGVGLNSPTTYQKYIFLYVIGAQGNSRFLNFYITITNI